MSVIQTTINSLLNRLKMNCEHSVILHSKSMDTNLGFGDRLRLKIHNLMCKVCAKYAEQLDFISENAKNQTLQEKEVKMDTDAKNRLKEALNSKLKS